MEAITQSDTIHIQVIFSEAVDVSGEPTLSLETGSTDTQALYTMGSGSDTLIFSYTIASNDSATDLDYKSTASLTLNGGTINATAAPDSAAFLTLPEPGTRGSLSSNKNISINTIAITNIAPTQNQSIPVQELTVNIPFTYTIPAGAFTDADNDPLTYFPSTTLPLLPNWLKLDTYTGIFSGTPVTEQGLTIYTFLASGGTASTDSTISITVNATPTLPTIADINYSPGSLISETLPAVIEGTGTKPIKYTLSPALPVWLMFSTETRMITGIAPTAEQTSLYTYTAEDKNGALAEQTFTLIIKTLELLPNILDKTYLLGNTINEILPAVTGGTGALTYTLMPELADGLTFSTATRAISGTPERLSRNEYTYTVEDSEGTSVSINFFIAIIAEVISPFPTKGNGRISDIIKYDRVTFPSIPIGTEFGSSVADLGDIDGNGIDDLAVGAHLDDSDGRDRGAVYILLMNADNTIKANTKIIHGSAGIDLVNGSRFGISVANIGDFDGNGINELAVGTRDKGIIYIVHLTRSGEPDRFSTLDFNDVNTILGNTDLISSDRFGFSIANLGDIDDDGVIDLAVGANKINDGNKGLVYILFMDKTETSDPTLKDVVKLDVTGANLNINDLFGFSVAKLGDLNQDGINDLAVGAPGDYGHANNTGVIHIFYLNRDGSVLGGFKLFDDAFNRHGDLAGSSIANLGDINGDGIDDIAVGAVGADSLPINNTGAVSTIFMGRARDQITTNDFFRIDNISHPGLNLSKNDLFGTSIANIGDRNGDGINDLAVGASADDSGGTDSGALYILYMNEETFIKSVTAAAENRSYNTNDTIHIQVIFSEAVDVSGTPRLTLETGSIDTPALYTMGSGSTVLTFVYTVVSNDLKQQTLVM